MFFECTEVILHLLPCLRNDDDGSFNGITSGAALQVVNAWDSNLKQHFLFFVTGSQRLPQPNTELLHIELPFVAFDQRDHQLMLSRLPQVHHVICTCEN